MTEGRVNHCVAIDEGIVTTKIAQMESVERDKLQQEINLYWPQANVTLNYSFGSVIGDSGRTFSHYIAPLGFLIARFYR
jgi:hypothetical protein